jgi:phosphatidylglycerophosphate synthase
METERWRDLVERFLETPALQLFAKAERDLVGASVGPYRIEARLGGGGMGVVYRARDTRLQRQVALKFLPQLLSHDANALTQFGREARAAAALNHPNICTIHEIGEHDGRPFLALELLEGQTLKHRMAEQALGMPEILDIASHIAAALETAHAKGIIHRDVKPANILVTTDGAVKVLDFGIAQMADSPGTAPSGIGTLPYMSPEQIQNGAGDARSDLFSLGVVIYEMAAGRRPFRGETKADLMASILHDAPLPLGQPGLDGILERCLAKQPAQRFRSAGELRAALQGLRRGMKDGGRREMSFVLADLERRFLERLARRLPGRIRPNQLTALGILGAVGTGVAYALTRYEPAWLWVASLMLIIYWLGDSLDGTLARVRSIERPRYGYYLDHTAGVFTTIVIGLGIGLSSYVNPVLALGLVVVYLALAINVYLESSVFGVVKISYGRIGPTEVRLVLVLVNTVVALAVSWHVQGPWPIRVVANWTVAVLLLAMVAVLVRRYARNLSRLARLEPSSPPRGPSV